MRKIFILVIATILLFVSVGCGRKQNKIVCTLDDGLYKQKITLFYEGAEVTKFVSKEVYPVDPSEATKEVTDTLKFFTDYNGNVDGFEVSVKAINGSTLIQVDIVHNYDVFDFEAYLSGTRLSKDDFVNLEIRREFFENKDFKCK